MRAHRRALSFAHVSVAAVAAVAAVALGGCGAVIEPGHRGLLFNPRRGGLQHEVLSPGYYHPGYFGRVDDFDITYSTHKEELQTISAEGLALAVKVAVIYRPIISELYELDTEIGPNYYDEVVGPEFRTAGRGVLARHSYRELQKANEKIEDEVESEMRRRLAGKHVEISSVVLEHVEYPEQILAVDRERIVGEQEAARRKAAQDTEASLQKKAIEYDAERARAKAIDDAERAVSRAAAQTREKELERKLAEEQAAIDKVKAENEAVTRVTHARAESEERKLLALAAAEEKKAEARNVTPMMVMMHAYDALGKLGGGSTSIMLGDWSHVPSFLFPSQMLNAMHLAAPGPVASSRRPPSTPTTTE